MIFRTIITNDYATYTFLSLQLPRSVKKKVKKKPADIQWRAFPYSYVSADYFFLLTSGSSVASRITNPNGLGAAAGIRVQGLPSS